MKHFLFTIFLFLLFKSYLSYSQNSSNDLEKIHLKKLYRLYFENENNKVLQSNILKVYYNKAIQSDSSIYKAKYYYLYLKSQPTQKAISCFDSVIKYSLNTGDKFFPLVAYHEKGLILQEIYDYESAFKNFIKAEKIAKKVNIDLYYMIRLDIATIKSEELGDINEALKIYKECFNYYRKKKYEKIDYLNRYPQTVFAIADAYISLKKYDSASIYNKMGVRYSIKYKNDFWKSLFIFNEGSNLINKKSYLQGIDSVNKALPSLIKNESLNVMSSYYFLGKAYEGMKKNNLALENYLKVDSIYKKNKVIFPEISDGYNFIINYYKKSKNQNLELRYTNSLVSIDSLTKKRYKYLDKAIRQKYEIPLLMEEKESTIQSLKNKIVIGICLFVLIVLGLLLHNNYQKKLYKKRFDELVLGIRKKHEEKSVENLELNDEKKINNIGIGEEIVKLILKRLNEFEKDQAYLNLDLNIQFLADEFETNTKYLSKIVNEYKQKSFIQYVNDLRIDYALKELQNNSKLRKYTMNALANEFGFNTSESFSNAFFKKTGIKPSFYIKEWENR